SSLSAPWNETTTPASGGATMVALAGARRTRCAGARKGQQESSKIALSARRLIISSLPCFAALISSALPVDLLRVSVSEQVRSGVAIAIQCIAMALVAVFLADRRGFSLFDPLFLIPFACLAALLVAPILVTMHRAGDNRRAFVRIGIAVGRACGAVAVIVLLCVGLLDLAAPHGLWLIPDWQVVLDAALLSIVTSALAAALICTLLKRVPPAVIVWGSRAVMLAAVAGWHWMPLAWHDAILGAIDAHGLTPISLALAGSVGVIAAGFITLAISAENGQKRSPQLDESRNTA